MPKKPCHSRSLAIPLKNPVIPLSNRVIPPKKPCHSDRSIPFRKEGNAQWRNLLFSRPNSIPLPKAKLHKAGATVEERRFSAA